MATNNPSDAFPKVTIVSERSPAITGNTDLQLSLFKGSITMAAKQ